MDRIVILDFCRGIFALLVLAYHYPPELLPTGFIQYYLISQSWIFVDFFFVLSGFIIALNYSKEKFYFKQFILKRIVRIYPLFIYSIFLFFLINFIVVRFSLIDNSITFLDLLYMSLESLFLLNSNMLMGGGVGMNYPSWSISAEMISYVIFGFILKFAFRFRQLIFFSIVFICLIYLFLINGQYGIKTEGDFGFIRGAFGFFSGAFISKWKSNKTLDNLTGSKKSILLL